MSTEKTLINGSRAQGKAEGLVEGEAKGEHLAKVAIAKNLLAAGVEPHTVSKSTGLSLDALSR